MAKKQESSLVAETPGIALPKTSPLSSFCFYALLLFLAGVGTMGCFFSAFSLSPDRPPLLLTMAVCALLSASHVFFKKRRWLFWLLPPLLWGLLLHHSFDSVSTGCLYTVNAVLRAYGEKLSLSLPVLASAPAAVSDLTAFAVFLQFPFFWLLALVWCQLQSSLSAFALTGLFLLIPMAPSILPDYWALGLLLLYWGFLLLFSSSLRKHYHFAKNQQSLGASFARVSSLALLGLLALVMLAVYRLYPPETYERPSFANEVRGEITEGFRSFPKLIKTGGFFGSGTTDRVDLSHMGSRSFSGKIVLRVRQDWEGGQPGEEDTPTARKEYLKSFSGSVYTGSSWERLDSQNNGPENALGSRHGQTLLSEIAETMPLPWADSPCTYTLSVESADGSGIPPYQPYGLSAFEPLPDHVAYQGDESLEAVGLFTSLTEYRLSARALPPEKGQINYTERLNGFLNRDGGTYAIPSIDGEDGASSRMDSLTISAAEGENRFVITSSTGEKWTVDAIRIGGDLSGDAAELSEALERYDEFVRNTYTQVPDSLRPFLESFVQEAGLSASQPENPLDCAQAVRALLAERCSYTLSPPAVPQGTDFAEYFLSVSHRGYCVHFATAAALLLRTMGVPARYAEGYAAPVGENGLWKNVPDRNAHAWVELYLSGTGWVPFEVTPAGPDSPAAYRNAAFPTGSEAAEPSPTPTPVPSSSSPPENSQSPSSALSSAPEASQTPVPSGTASQPGQEPPRLFGIELSGENLPVFLGMFSPVLVPLALLLAVLLYRGLRLSLRRLLFRRSDRNRAALSVYSHLLKLYRAMELLPGKPARPPEEITELALRARFSPHRLSAADLSQLTGLAAQLEKKLEKGLSRKQRLFYKYLVCLF